MFSNFTEETATGTGNTLALAGATADHIAFGESFEDGDLVSYSLEDSGGTIKVAGIGTYVSATDDITRNDSWNWNGTAVDKDPSTNITLSGGTHTVRCDVVGGSLFRSRRGELYDTTNYYHTPDNVPDSNAITLATADRLILTPAMFYSAVTITKIVINVNTADAAASNNRWGVYSCGADGKPDELLLDTGHITLSSTGNTITTLPSALELRAGAYFFAFVSDSASVLRVYSPGLESDTSSWLGRAKNISNRAVRPYQNSVTGALPSTFVRSNSSAQAYPVGFQ